MTSPGSAVLLTLLLLGACRGGTHDANERAATTHVQPPDGAYADRVAIYMEATTAELDSARARLPEADFYVMADDLMFYRSSAYDYLERSGVRVVRLTGRRPLSFEVNGATRTYGFEGFEPLDAIVLFEPGREPRVIAPVDLHVVDEYFALPAGAPSALEAADASSAKR